LGALGKKSKAQTLLLDHSLNEPVALLDTTFDGFADGCLLSRQARDDALGIGHDLDAPANIHRLRVDINADFGDLTRGQTEESNRRSHR
jgi:hypothetical protein